jgi:hypothetical protein
MWPALWELGLKSCKKGWEEKTGDGFMGVKGLGTTNEAWGHGKGHQVKTGW